MQIDGRSAIGLRARNILEGRIYRAILILILTSAAIGCAAPPNERFEDVSQAIERAREAGAAYRAADAFAAAETALASARREIEEQKARPLPVRRFRIALGLLDDAEVQARAALDAAEAGAAEARARAAQAIESANDTIESARIAWREIPRSADTADDRAGLKEDLAALDSQLAEAAEHYETGAFDEAAANAEAALARGRKIASAAARSLEHHLSP